MAERRGPRRPSSSARSHLLTVLGEFVLPVGGGLWTATAIEVLALLGFNERNARQALARLNHEGVLDVERRGRRARLNLSTAGRELLTAGADRIYRFGQRSRGWDGHWLLVLCSVPESRRAERRRFQTRMAFAGFGTLAPGVAISPHRDAEADANRILRDLDLVTGAMVFVAETGTLLPDADLLARAWDLDELSGAYQEFLAGFAEVDPPDPSACFETLTHLVHAWRRFPFIDPEIPGELLRPDWPGTAAEALFSGLRERWSAEATRFFREADAAND